jgi:hypothetical protein
LQTHFSFGDKSDDEKENGQSTQSRTKRWDDVNGHTDL